MSDWYTEDTEPQPNGIVGGDGAGEAVSVRFYHRTQPAQVTVNVYTVDMSERSEDAADWIDVEEQVEYAIFSSREEMLAGDTEPIWCEYDYDDASYAAFTDDERAESERDAAALRWLNNGADWYLSWDGVTTG